MTKRKIKEPSYDELLSAIKQELVALDARVSSLHEGCSHLIKAMKLIPSMLREIYGLGKED